MKNCASGFDSRSFLFFGLKMMEAKEKMHAKALPSAPTDNISDEGHIKFSGSDAPEEQDLSNVTEIDGGILQYVRRRMHCETVTLEVRREAAAFQREMDRMQGW